VDLADPTRAITPTLDGPILAVLASVGRPLTVGEIAAAVPRGSEIGLRKAVARLVDQGIVIATQMGRNVVHELNREHIAAPAAAVLGGLRTELWKRLREPTYASVFGSAARHDGGPESDIDLLLVHPPFPGDTPPLRSERGLLGLLGDIAVDLSLKAQVAGNESDWETQVDELRTKVQRWTGNPLQVIDVSIWQWADMRSTDPALLEEITRDGITVSGQPFDLAPRAKQG
jgi:predicted nucleotidyltransferase